MTNIRDQYKKLKIPILEDINKVMSGKKEDYKNQTYKDIRDYPVCIVGTVREKLGLSVNYIIKTYYNDITIENPNYCAKCKDLADEFPNPIEYYVEAKSTAQYNKEEWSIKWKYEQEAKEQKEKYEALLIELKQHLILNHGVKLN